MNNTLTSASDYFAFMIRILKVQFTDLKPILHRLSFLPFFDTCGHYGRFYDDRAVTVIDDTFDLIIKVIFII